MHVIKQEPL